MHVQAVLFCWCCGWFCWGAHTHIVMRICVCVHHIYALLCVVTVVGGMCVLCVHVHYVADGTTTSSWYSHYSSYSVNA